MGSWGKNLADVRRHALLRCRRHLKEPAPHPGIDG